MVKLKPGLHAGWHTRHGEGVPQDILEELGVQILLGIPTSLPSAGVERVRKLGGFASLLCLAAGILTDSGAFKVFSLNELRKVTEEA